MRFVSALRLLALTLLLTSSSVSAQQKSTVEPKWGYPEHIELHFLDKKQRLFLHETKALPLKIAGSFAYESFYVDKSRTIYALAGQGRIYYGSNVIDVSESGLLINGISMPTSVRTAVLDSNGEMVLGAYIRTFD